jgi:hypothetical protein
MPDEYLLQQRDALGKKLGQTDEELKSLKVQAKMPFPEEANRSVQRQIAKAQDDLMDAQRELMERKAMQGDSGGGGSAQTNGVEVSVPADKLTSYSFATTKLDELKRQENELLLQYTAAYPLVQNVRDRIEQLTRQKADLEDHYPGLKHILVGGTQLGTNTVGTEVLVARVAARSAVLSNVQAQASQIMDLQPKISELERRRAEEQRAYEAVMGRLDQQQRNESMVAGKDLNMSNVESRDWTTRR